MSPPTPTPAHAPPPKPAGEAHPAVQLALLVGLFALLLNAAFYFLADAYFADRATTMTADELARAGGTKLAFAAFTVITGGAVVAAAAAPWHVAHAIAGLAGATALVGGFAAAIAGWAALGASLIVCGPVLGILVWRSIHGSRAAWAAMIGLCATAAVVTLFAAPKLGRLLGLGLWPGMTVPGVLAAGVIGLRLISARFREPAGA
jgi:hypothetical protein